MGVPQLDEQGDEGAAGQDGLDAAFLDLLDRGWGAEVVVVDGQGALIGAFRDKVGFGCACPAIVDRSRLALRR
ncbi:MULTISPECIES: hypothetical protein [Streptomyces]|uniref:hypothetical protein n=1 Tax=Streptomyces TaxID=1883 RepID=UPI001CEF82C5|nr:MULTISPECIES: hypothetical protein [Streptomyces]